MKKVTYIILGAMIAILPSCQSLVEGLDDHPLKLEIDEIPPLELLTGVQLANTLAQVGHLNRIGGMYTGQLIGFQSQYLGFYNYDLTRSTVSSTWNRVYQGVVPQVRVIQDKIGNSNDLLFGICYIMEAHAVGTMASLIGDVPYFEIFDPNFETPALDKQSVVFEELQNTLTIAIDLLENANDGAIAEDIYYNGNRAKWIEAAWTLKARYYMHTKAYDLAYEAAQNGISSDENTMFFTPIGETGILGNKNTFYTLLSGTRVGDMGTGDSHLIQMLRATSAESRRNAKTDESARLAYYTINEAPSTNEPNLGVATEMEPQKLISYDENQLILAEAGTRTLNFETGLTHLNELRAYLDAGGGLNEAFIESPHTYTAYEAVDFQSGGLENADNIDATRALLREIIEERYVSGFLTYMPFDDARRLRKSDNDIAVNIPLNTSTATIQPERFFYPENEMDANPNIPRDMTIYDVTEVNK